MSKLAQKYEDDLVNSIIDAVKTYQKQVIKELVTESEYEEIVDAVKYKNSNSIVKILLKIGAVINPKKSNKEDKKTKPNTTSDNLKELYLHELDNEIVYFKEKLIELFEDFDNRTIKCVIESKLFNDMIKNNNIKKVDELII